MSTLVGLLAAASDIHEIRTGWGSVIFVGAFVLACLIVGIWWLSR